MNVRGLLWGAVLNALPLGVGLHAQMPPPNIIVVMGDDIGWCNIGVYNQGPMPGRTPNLDRLANEGMRFTDHYAEANCASGRANFITGELPIRTGLTTAGQAESPLGIPDEAATIAQALGASTCPQLRRRLTKRSQDARWASSVGVAPPDEIGWCTRCSLR
jgi:hypothetical protein